MVHPDTIIGVKFMLDTICLAVSLLRVYALRKRLNRYQTTAHICIALTFASAAISHGFYYEALFTEKALIKLFKGDMKLVDAGIGPSVFTDVCEFRAAMAEKTGC